MLKILITISSFDPGYKIGGPAVTIKNLIQNYSDRFQFYILCRNHDWGEKDKPFMNVEYNTWIKKDNYSIMYATDEKFNKNLLLSIIDDFDIVYCTGVFSKLSLAAAIHCKRNPSNRIIIAPMGSLFDDAVRIKIVKKRLFFFVTKLFGVFKNVMWSVSSALEEASVRKIYGKKANCIIAEDAISFVEIKKTYSKTKNKKIRIIYASRIHPHKGLMECAQILQSIESEIVFDIYGTIEDRYYFDECMNLFKKMPLNIDVNYYGEFKPSDSVALLSQYDVFLLPTASENFGHIIFEALNASCIPVISANTPWGEIGSKECGFVCDRTNLESFRNAILTICSMPFTELEKYKNNCYNFAYTKYKQSVANSGYLKLFKYEK